MITERRWVLAPQKQEVFSLIRKEPKELKFPLPVTSTKGGTQGSELCVQRTLPSEQPRSGCPVRVRPPEGHEDRQREVHSSAGSAVWRRIAANRGTQNQRVGLQAVLERISAVPRTLKGRAELRCVDLTLLAASVPALGIPSEEDESMCSTIAEELKKPLAGSGAGLPKRVASVHREQRVPVVPTWPSQAVYASERKDSDAEVQNAFD